MLSNINIDAHQAYGVCARDNSRSSILLSWLALSAAWRRSNEASLNSLARLGCDDVACVQLRNNERLYGRQARDWYGDD